MMGADNRGALRAMRRTKGALGQHLVDHFHEQVDIMQQRHPRARMVLRWTLRHVGMAENERADAEAKELQEVSPVWETSSPGHARGKSRKVSWQRSNGITKRSRQRLPLSSRSRQDTYSYV